jgi:putative hydrolase of the HAD superfamily
MMIKSVFFDFWSTLVVFEGEEAVIQMRRERAKRFRREFGDCGYIFTLERIWQAFETVRSRCFELRNSNHKEIRASEVALWILEELGVAPKGVHDRFTDLYSNAVLSMNLSLQDGTAQVLESLKKNGLKIGLISNTEHGGIERKLLKEMGIDQYFDSLVLSCDIGIRKPAPEIFRHALTSLSVQAEESLHVGDSPEMDVSGSRRAGMIGIYLKAQEVPYPDELLQPDATIEKLTEIPGLLVGAFN